MLIKFKHERLPTFCFYCGLIGHSEKFCEALFDNAGNKESKRFDASLRASVRNQLHVGKNQWLRGADGGKLNSGRKEESGVGDGIRKTDQAKSVVTNSNDNRVVQCVRGEIRGSVGDSVIQGYDDDISNDGVIILNQKRPRISEDGLGDNLSMGCDDESRDLDVNMIDGPGRNKKTWHWRDLVSRHARHNEYLSLEL